MSQTLSMLRASLRSENAAFAKAALIYRTGKRMRRIALVMATLGALFAPVLTGSLRDFCLRPVVPFGGISLVSMRGEMLLLCAKFADEGVPCDTTKLDPDAEKAYVPTSKLDLIEILIIVRDASLGVIAPSAFLLMLWLSWRSYLELATA